MGGAQCCILGEGVDKYKTKCVYLEAGAVLPTAARCCSRTSGNQMQSHSVEIRPHDSRCRYWAKISRAGDPLPLPCDVEGANDIPGSYLHRGDEELQAGDVLFEGESNHHRRTDRGWSYCVTCAMPSGDLVCLFSGFSEEKRLLKAQGMSPELLKGSGDIAAMVRIAHAVRLGMNLVQPVPQRSEPQTEQAQPATV